jgi:hypothetical protein
VPYLLPTVADDIDTSEELEKYLEKDWAEHVEALTTWMAKPIYPGI